MIVEFHKRFEKDFKKLHPKLKQKTYLAIEKFKENPFDRQLHNHTLHGNLKNVRAISVTGDLRIVFKEFDNYVTVLLLRVGTHNQVY